MDDSFPSGVFAEYQRRAHGGSLHRRLLSADHLHRCSTGTQSKVGAQTLVRLFCSVFVWTVNAALSLIQTQTTDALRHS